jgi:hypothetical protein
MNESILSNHHLRLIIRQAADGGYAVDEIALAGPNGWIRLAAGVPGGEFSTSLGGASASRCVVERAGGAWIARLSARGEAWQAEEVITLDAEQALVRREQTYHFTADCELALHPGWLLPDAPGLRYTFALRAHEQPPGGLPALRSDVGWALPFPFHVWHTGEWVALCGVDRTRSAGTLDFEPSAGGQGARVRVYYPDTTEQPEGFGELPRIPSTARVSAGASITLSEVFAARPLAPGQEPLLEAERLAAGLLLGASPPQRGLAEAADGIAESYARNGLWEPDAFGPGRGWFLNMWTYTQAGEPRRKGPGGGYYDLGWGEGIAVETFVALARHWRRTGRAGLLRYVDEMTRSLDLFKRAPGDDQPYFDRSDGRRFGDFMLDYAPPGRRIWTHSLGHTGSQLLTAYAEAEGYPNPAARAAWLSAGRSIAGYLTRQQRADGDLNDIFDDQDREVNAKPHRIPARAVACGLWTRLAAIDGRPDYLERALALARAAGPDIERYEWHNQMIDGLSTEIEFVDGEAAWYALEGLAPLYAATRDPYTLNLCRKAAAFGIAWTYFYDLPSAHGGVARGGQCCRMPDYPLLYPIGPAKAVEPLLILSRATGDGFYERMAGEMAAFIAAYRIDAPDRPWHGAIIHAIDQHSGKHWGPDKCGQVDSGMATGNSLAALEAWMAHAAGRAAAGVKGEA